MRIDWASNYSGEFSVIKVKPGRENKNIEVRIGKITARTRVALTNASHQIGNRVRREARRSILEGPKTGIAYNLRLRGKRVRHRASAPGEAPANFTGTLRKSITYEVASGNRLLEITAGDGTNELEYSRILEEGDGILQRPYLITAITRLRRDTVKYFETYLEREYDN